MSLALAIKMTEDLNKQLDRIWQEAHAGDLMVTLPEIRNLLKSTDPEDRLRGLLLLRRHIDERDLKDEFFQLAKPMIEDENNNCRWQALIVIGEFIQSKPDEVWRVVREYAESEDDDMRLGVAKVLLEPPSTM